ncbi:acyl-CoA thioesterase [Prescottella subtropica]|uniref:acyl-CoA thioesterase n=1 Tax=Prescottella subtropica TaxID=2545757 RepID=UPI0010F9211B|nr:thioesterase family protein [Prescottella subtropica]
MSEPRAEAYPALWPVPTRWSDDDTAYAAYFATAVGGWLMASTGLDIRTLAAVAVVAESACRFVRDIAFPDQLHVGLSVDHLDDDRVEYALAIFREDPDGDLEVAATGRLVHRYVDPVTRQPAPIPPEIRSAALLLTEPV